MCLSLPAISSVDSTLSLTTSQRQVSTPRVPVVPVEVASMGGLVSSGQQARAGGWLVFSFQINKKQIERDSYVFSLVCFSWLCTFSLALFKRHFWDLFSDFSKQIQILGLCIVFVGVYGQCSGFLGCSEQNRRRYPYLCYQMIVESLP